MAHVLAAERGVRDTTDRDDAAPTRELGEERSACFHLRASGPAVVRLGSGMRRHDVPEEDVVLELQVGERLADDRGRRLRRPGAGELALGREGDPADARAAVAGRLADEDEGRVPPALEVVREAATPELGAGVLVEGRADLRAGQAADEPWDV